MSETELIDRLEFVDRIGQRGLSLRVWPNGMVRVNKPRNISRKQATRFVASKKSWIEKQLKSHEELYNFYVPQKISENLYVYTEDSDITEVKVTSSGIRIRRPKSQSGDFWQWYQLARPTIKKVLTNNARPFLTKRTMELADTAKFEPSKISVKFMRSRWGSCNRQGVIALNSQLMRLPPHLIDYVILHELSHLRAHNHGKAFYAELSKYLPDFTTHQRELRRWRLFA